MVIKVAYINVDGGFGQPLNREYYIINAIAIYWLQLLRM